MSRNFDLIKEIERERELTATANHPQVSTPRAVIKGVVSQAGGNPGGKELARLVEGIFLSATAPAPRKVVFCGVDEESGSSSVCASVGRILASKGAKSVCVVDANLRLARLSRILGVDSTIAIHKEASFDPERCAQVDGGLWLAGTDHLADTHGLPLPDMEVERRLTHLGSSFDYLLIDAPGLAICSDAALLGKIADATILVIEAGLTRRAGAVAAKAVLDAAGVRLYGTVLHNWTLPLPETMFNRL
jgi:MinD-like ATPase involved in chromosome partitioning or flagellar assembly